MRPSEPQFYFEKMVAESGSSVANLTLSSAVRLMIEFYRQVRAADCLLEDDGDMLLFQWGIYDWGNGKSFHYNITRQFVPSDEEKEWLSQLSLTIYFPVIPALEALAAGNRWCSSPTEADAFEQFVLSHEATSTVSNLAQLNVTLTWNEV